LKKWKHPTTLNELFKKEMGQKERNELFEVFNKLPYSGYYSNGKCPEELAKAAYAYM